jgi:hypothetical protein
MNAKRFLITAVCFVLSVLCTLTPPALAANIVVNGSFEVDDFGTSGGGQRLGLIGNDVTGWFIPNGDGIYPWGLQNTNQYGAGPAADGNQWLILGEDGTNVEYTIQQTLNGLTAGNVYTLSFAIASELGCCSIAEVSFLSGSSTGAQNFNAPNSGSFWTQWGTHTMNFVATSNSVTLQFKNLVNSQTGGIDLGLDNVIVDASAVPEPASFVLGASALLGLTLLRRKRIH